MAQVVLFLVLVSSLVLLGLGVTSRRLQDGKFYKLPQSTRVLVVGNSHPKAALDDNLLPETQNLADVGESPFYTYLKLKALLVNNPHVSTVYFEFTDKHFEDWMEGWVWEDKHVDRRFFKYYLFMDRDDLLRLARLNLRAMVTAQAQILRRNLKVVAGSRTAIEANEWGGYLPLEERLQPDKLEKPEPPANLSPGQTPLTLLYVEKIVDLCKERGVQLRFIRCPHNEAYRGWCEAQLRAALDDRFPSVPFLDFRTFPLKSDQFADLSHLNSEGSRIFTVFFAGLLENGLNEDESPESSVRAAVAAAQLNFRVVERADSTVGAH